MQLCRCIRSGSAVMEQVHSMGNICTYVLLRWVGFLAVTSDGGLLACPGWTISATHTNFLQSELFSFLFLFSEGDYNGARRRAPLKPYSWVGSINLVNAAGLRPQDSAFVGLSNFPSFDRNHADEELGKLRFGFF